MANYYCTIRTNYFKVKDEQMFLDYMSEVCADDEIHLFEKEGKDGATYHGFGCYGYIYGCCKYDDDDPDYDLFIDGLRCHVADDDAIIIFEAGYEKLRYVTGCATVITSKGVEFIDIEEVATKKAAELLGYKNYSTLCYY